MKKDHSRNLRYCEKIKQTECFLDTTGLQKKIRGKIKEDNIDTIDAEIKMREIQSFWKTGWEYDRTHHTYLEPKVTIPQVYVEQPKESPPELQRFYELLSKFINKLKIEQEDETTYRIALKTYPYSRSVDFDLSTDPEKTAYLASQHLLRTFSNITSQMSMSLEHSRQLANDFMLEQTDMTNKNALDFLQIACERILNCNQPQTEEEISAYETKSETCKFISFMIEELLTSTAREQSMHSSIIVIQPQLGQLTYLLHPMCFVFYGLFSHELLIRSAKKIRGKCYVEQLQKPLVLDHQNLAFPFDKLLHIKDNLMIQEHRHSKLLLLNLDGYESQFTLQFLRNFHKHVMYISFPKFSLNPSDDSYNKRFHKKIMFNHTKPQGELFFDEEEGEESLTFRKEELISNPENYYKIIQSLYPENQTELNVPDYNQNMYVFPIRMDNLKSNKEPPPDKKDIEPYQSLFIRFLLRDHLYSEILKFRPSTIIISYSGRISIENEHFLEMMQELSKICSKIILFPNFTTALAKKKMNEYLEKFSSSPYYDKIYNDIGRFIINQPHHSLLERKLQAYYQYSRCNPFEIDLMDKLSIFLKVTSGHYNLSKAVEQQSFQAKYRNCQIFDYLIHLFEALKYDYDHCKKRLKRGSLQVAKTIMQQSIKKHPKLLQSCVPAYYKQLFQQIQNIIINRFTIFQSDPQKYNEYQLLLQQLLAKTIDEQNDLSELDRKWQQFKIQEQLSISNNRYHEFNYLQIETELSKEEYLNIKSEKMDNLNNVYKLSFCHRHRNTEIIKIYPETTLHYQVYQPSLKSKKPQFHLLLTNVLNLEQNNYQHYATRPKISNKKEQRCPVTPILFCSQQGPIVPKHKFKLWTQWNYAETQNYMLLFWPQEFDHITYYLHKMLKKKYETGLSNYIFICHKAHDFLPRADKAFFHLLTLPEQLPVLPRWGCSAMFVGDQLFIFGGFHDRQSNYLQLQNEISTLDLTDFRPNSYEQKKIFNLSKQLYNGQAFLGHLRQGRKPNSYVRPRMQFEFYPLEDLDMDRNQPPEQNNQNQMQEENQHDVRTIIMIGGYGQDFQTPYSLILNYYYQLKFNIPQRRLISIHKKMIYDKSVPTNIRGMIKNRGIFNRNNVLDQSSSDQKQLKIREGVTTNHHYFAHRVVYAITDGQLMAKIKNLYALQMFQICKKDYRQFAELIGEVKVNRQYDPAQIKKIQGHNHYLQVELKDKVYLYSLYLELSGDEVEEVPLTNQSIVSIDTKKYTVYAIVCHSKYTQNKSILTYNTLAEPDPYLLNQQQHYALVLKQLHSFPFSINLHCLIACNVNELVLLQGTSLKGNVIPECFVKIKSKSQNDIKTQQIMPNSLPDEDLEEVTTFFMRKNNIVRSISLARNQDRPEEITIIRETIDIQRFTEGWKTNQIIPSIVFTCKKQKIKPLQLEIRAEEQTEDNAHLIITTSKPNKKYWIKLNNIKDQAQSLEVTEEEPIDEVRFKSQPLLPSTTKTTDKYDDHSYFG